MDNKCNIIVIDDELGMREGVRRVLAPIGYKIDTAETGEEGLSFFEKKSYVLALVDYKMPGMNGLEVLKKIDEISPNTVVIIMTAYASLETAVEATKKGAYDFIAKPFTPDELLNCVNRAIERNQLFVETERLKKEQERNLMDLYIEKSRLKTIINSLNEGVIITNTKGELALYNTFLRSLFDFKGKIGLPLTESITNQEITDQIKNLLESDPEKTHMLSREIELGGKVYRTDSTILKHEDNQVIGCATVLKDISEQKQIDNLKSQFVSMVSHELKAPISAIKGYIDIILSGAIKNNPDKERDYLERSSLRSGSLIKLIKDLLAISRIENQTKERVLEEINLADIISELVEFFQNEIKTKGIEVENNIGADLPKIFADKDEIGIIFTNLISNAIKYNKENGKIILSSQCNGNFLSITVKDTGIGLKEEDRNRLFEDFFRAKNEHTRTITGTGLGLSIVKRIVELNFGTIDVESEYEQGTSFKVNLPLQI